MHIKIRETPISRALCFLAMAMFVAAAQSAPEEPVATERAAGTTPSRTELFGPGTSLFGAAVTLRATVLPSTASGFVTFYDGASILGTSRLIGSQATLTTTLLPTGNRVLHALYGGNTIYNVSRSVQGGHTVRANSGRGFLPEAAINTGGTNALDIKIGDFDGNGFADVVLVNVGSSNISVLLGRGDGQFDPAVNYPALTRVSDLALGDFDRNGTTDLAVVEDSTRFVQIWLGLGNGQFQRSAGVDSRDPLSKSIAVGDFNGDGQPDLATAGYNSNILSVMLGNGDGTFATAVTSNAGMQGPSSLAVGDFNRDRIADLVVTNNLTGTVPQHTLAVRLGVGNGTFRAPSYLRAGVAPRSVVVADFNGDGNEDLAAANAESSYISVLRGAGDGTFTDALDTTGVGQNYSIAVGDFNGDERPDLVVTYPSSANVRLLIGDGSGRFQSGGSAGTVSLRGTIPGVAVGDFNGDRIADLAVANGSVMSVLLAQAPVQAPTVSLTASLNPSVLGQEVTLTAAVSPSAATGSVTFYDGTALLGTRALTAGRAELKTSMLAAGRRSLRAHYIGNADYSAGTSTVLTATVAANPGLGFPSEWPTNGTGDRPYSLTIGDFNADGKPDVATANQANNTVTVLAGRDGSLTGGVNQNHNTGQGPVSVAAGDFNGDGRTDLATANAGGSNVSVLLANGAYSFLPAVNYAAGSGPYSVAVGDFNGDGSADLAVANSTGGNVSVLLGDGSGRFPTTPVNYAAGARPIFVATGDFDGDGNADLAVANYNGANISVLLGDGSGKFGAARNINVGLSPVSMAVGDFNSDGKHDLAVSVQGDGTVSVLLGAGNGTFTASGYRAGASPTSVAVGDINGDGRLDLIAANQRGANLSLLRGLGDGSFEPAQSIPAGQEPTSVAVGDFNGDGRSDLVVANYLANGTVGLLLGQAAAPAPARPVISISSGDRQSGPAGSRVTVAVRVADASGPVSGFAVRFRVLSGSAQLASPTAATNQNGIASMVVTLGPETGPVRILATSAAFSDEIPQSVTFSLDVLPGRSTISIFSGDGQSGPPGTRVTIAVRITDAAGAPSFDVPVRFGVVSGPATLSSPTARTNQSGTASIQVTLGPGTGPVRIQANPDFFVTGELPQSVTFSLNVLPGRPSITIFSGDGQSGAPGTRVTIAARVADGAGTALRDVAVRFAVLSGAAQLGSATAQTNQNGVASTEVTLGPASGPVRITASHSLLLDEGPQSVTFNLTVSSNTPSTMTISFGDGLSGPPGARVGIAVKVADAAGAPVRDVTVRFSVAGGSAQIAGTGTDLLFSRSVETSAEGIATVQVVLGASPGPVRILAASTGLPSVAFNLTITPPPEAAISAYIPNAADRAVSVMDTVTNTVTATIDLLEKDRVPVGVAVNPRGTRVYVTNTCDNVLSDLTACRAGENGSVSVIETAGNTVVASIPIANQPMGVAVSPDGSRAYVVNVCGVDCLESTPRGAVSVIDVKEGSATENTVLEVIPVPGAYSIGIAVNGDGSRLYVTNLSDLELDAQGNVSVIDTAESSVVAVIPVPLNAKAAVLHPALPRLYVSSTSGVSVIDTAGNTLIATLDLARMYTLGLAISADGSRLYATDVDESGVKVILTAGDDLQLETTIATSSIAVGLSLHPKEPRLYVTHTFDSTVSVIDTTTNEVSGDPIAVGGFPTGFGQFLKPQTPVAGAVSEAVRGGAVRRPKTESPDLVIPAMQSLIEVSSSFHWKQGADSSPDSGLQAALEDATAGRTYAAIRQMHLFIDRTNAGRGSGLTSAQASILAKAGRQIIALMEASARTSRQ